MRWCTNVSLFLVRIDTHFPQNRAGENSSLGTPGQRTSSVLPDLLSQASPATPPRHDKSASEEVSICLKNAIDSWRKKSHPTSLSPISICSLHSATGLVFPRTHTSVRTYIMYHDHICCFRIVIKRSLGYVENRLYSNVGSDKFSKITSRRSMNFLCAVKK